MRADNKKRAFEIVKGCLTEFIKDTRTDTDFPRCLYCGAGVTLGHTDNCVAGDAEKLRRRLEEMGDFYPGRISGPR